MLQRREVCIPSVEAMLRVRCRSRQVADGANNHDPDIMDKHQIFATVTVSYGLHARLGFRIGVYHGVCYAPLQGVAHQ